MSNLQSGLTGNKRYVCSNCYRMFEERSLWCPRCETKTMCELRPYKSQER